MTAALWAMVFACASESRHTSGEPAKRDRFASSLTMMSDLFGPTVNPITGFGPGAA
jgi:hypothetical protein